ncbi:MAG: THUMP domain-containing protein [Thermoplasmata archaeon]|nr:THUMP domain-containing protein [Thermoplasmata archaeon]MCI4359369.1 THUMP domain-containing protein [Thermoplasmata archaeon]
MTALVLVRYGELALKSPPVRREFERTLSRNILDQFAAVGIECRIRSDHGHLYVEAADPGPAVRLLRRVFGITSVSEVHATTSDRPSLEEAIRSLSRPHLFPGARFAIRARRTGQHPYTSQELARDLGGRVLETWPDLALRVDLTEPEVEIFVEVRGPKAYLYFDRAAGPGGLPLGVAGRVVALVDGTRGALGAWLMMKRGCRCAFVSTAGGHAFVEGVLQRFDPKSVSAAAVTSDEVSGSLQRAADSWGADGLVLPLMVDDYPAARERWSDRVVFSPTVGLTDEEVEGRWHGVVELASP